MALFQALYVLPLLAAAYAAGDSTPAVLQLPTDADVATRAELAYTVFPVNGTLQAGQELMQVRWASLLFSRVLTCQ